MRKHQELSLEQIIEQVRVDQLVSDDFCLYGKEDGELALDSLYWVSDYPEVVEYHDVYPDDVICYIIHGGEMAHVFYSAEEKHIESMYRET